MKIEIASTGIRAKVLIDGEDISNKVQEIKYEHRANAAPIVTLTLLPDEFNIELDEIAIPNFVRGGIVSSEHLANIGEHPKDGEVILQIDGKEIARALNLKQKDKEN